MSEAKTLPVVTFDDREHQYYINESPVPSVTQILKKAGWIDGRFFAPKAAHRGTVAHEAIVLADQDIVRPDGYDEAIAGYVMAFLRFRREKQWVTEGSEEIVFSTDGRWAGTQDLRGYMGEKPVVIDIKTGKPAEWHGVQLAAYRTAEYRMQRDGSIVEQDDTYAVRNLYVQKNGRYKLSDRFNALRYDSPVWLTRWHSALKVAGGGYGSD